MTKNSATSRLSGGISTLVTAKDDPANRSAEEKKELANELARATQMGALGLQETQAYLADVASARANQYLVQESEHSSWLTKNVQALLAFCVTGSAFVLFTVVIVGTSMRWFADNQNKDIIIYILGALTTVATQVVSYYFGSSAGSADKSRALNAIAKVNKP